MNPSSPLRSRRDFLGSIGGGFADHARFKTVCQMQVLDTPADVTKGEVLR